MNNSEIENDEIVSDIIHTEHVVAKIIGWTGSLASVSAPSLMIQLKSRKDAAVFELMRVESVSKSASNEVVSEKRSLVLEIESQIDRAKSCLHAIRDELAKGEESELILDQKATDWTGDEFLTLASAEWWARKNYGLSLRHNNFIVENVPTKASETQVLPLPDNKPWLQVDPRDPAREYDWYTPARYFARQLVSNDPTLLDNRENLAKQVVTSLTKVGIFKRGGKLPLGSGTVLKAFSNVCLG